MQTRLLPEKYRSQIAGVLHCYDRVILTGTLPQFCFAKGMTSYLFAHQIRIFDYTKFTAPLREKIREHAEALAHANGIQIEFVRKKNFR
ncbi:MAG: hypothetical protein DKINENOH_01097 [bacterium]|nr:hypothetical protein [bacterium]